MDPQPPAATGPRTCPASSHYGVTGFLTRSRSEFDGASTLGGNATGAMIFGHCICGKQGGGNHNVTMMFANTSIASKLMLGSSQSPKVSQCFALGGYVAAALTGGSFVGYLIGHFGLLAQLFAWLPWIAITSVAGSIAYAVRKPAPIRSDDSRLAICAAAFLIGATAFWAIGFSPRQTLWGDRIAGAIPFNDAESYYDVMVQWPMESLDWFNARRSVYAALCAFQGWLSAWDLRTFLMVRAGVFSISMIALYFAISNRVNWLAATATVAGIFWLCARYIGSTLSEASGVSFSALAVALILMPSSVRSPLHRIMACILLAGSWVVRPVNPLFPLTMIAFLTDASQTGRPFIQRLLCLGVLCSLIMFVLPSLLNNAVAERNSAVNSNYSHLILAFAKGVSWGVASKDHAPQLNGLTESDASDARVRLAIDALRDDPTRCLQWAGGQIQRSTSALASWITVGRSGSHIVGWIAFVAICGLALFTRNAVCLVPAIAVLALLSGAPLLWDGDGKRTSAALWPSLMVSLATPAFLIQRLCAEAQPHRFSEFKRYFAQAAALVVVMMLVMSCVYMITSYATKSPSGSRECIAIKFDDRAQCSGQWDGANSTRCNIDDAIDWFGNSRLTRTRDFLTQHREHVVGIYRKPTNLTRNAHGELGLFVIECKPSLPSGAEHTKLDYTFVVERDSDSR